MKYLQLIRDAEYLTIGDLCEAISDRQLPATIEDGHYVVRKRDIKRFMQTAQDYAPFCLPGQSTREPVLAAG